MWLNDIHFHSQRTHTLLFGQGAKGDTGSKGGPGTNGEPVSHLMSVSPYVTSEILVKSVDLLFDLKGVLDHSGLHKGLSVKSRTQMWS